MENLGNLYKILRLRVTEINVRREKRAFQCIKFKVSEGKSQAQETVAGSWKAWLTCRRL